MPDPYESTERVTRLSWFPLSNMKFKFTSMWEIKQTVRETGRFALYHRYMSWQTSFLERECNWPHWTESFVCRGRISSSGQIKLSIFGTVYTVCFAILFFYEVAVSGIWWNKWQHVPLNSAPPPTLLEEK